MAALVVCVAAPVACSVAPTAPEPNAVVIADARGELSAGQSRKVLERLEDGGENAGLARMVADIGALSAVPIYQDNRAELLIDGPDTYASMLQAIEGAQRHVFLETYIFADDEAGERFARELEKRAREGVVVKVIYDAIGSMRTAEDFFARMEDSGIRLIEFNEVNPVEGGSPLALNHRNHRKLLVVDGAVAYTGGINLSATYSSRSTGRPKPEPIRQGWRDTHVAIRGPAVAGFQRIFLDHWRALGGAVLVPDTPDGATPAQGSDVVGILTAEGADKEQSAIFEAYVSAMKLARERIWITQAYFAPDERFMDLLERAARRGVDVRLLVPGFSDSRLVMNASRSRYSRLLEAGVRIYESNHDFLHAKTAVVDGIWSTVGSSNLDYRSFLHNEEINAFILGDEFGEAMEAQFLHDIGEAEEIRPETWSRRSPLRKLTEKLSWMIEYWL